MRRVLGVVGATVALAVGLAAPARADHLAGASADGSACSAGPLAQPVPIHLETTEVRLVRRASGAIRLRCRFDVPGYVSAEESYFETARVLPTRVVRLDVVLCAHPDRRDFGEPMAPSSSFVLRPTGRAVLRCDWPAPGS